MPSRPRRTTDGLGIDGGGHPWSLMVDGWFREGEPGEYSGPALIYTICEGIRMYVIRVAVSQFPR
jgi:hypothetical protein